jgi:hypothetical protein
VKLKKFIFQLLALVSALLFAGYILPDLIHINISFSEISILTLCFAAVTLIAIYIFHRGMKKDPSGRTMYIMVALSIKMLIEMVLALFWFFVAKKTSLTSLVLFFVLYLAFSLFSIALMLSTLKNKSL